ncbi:MAG TPA: carbamoyl-phosphate synthase (glutamine-hydrolyzing) small subunit [Bacteroidales bacterium]|nr:carbamoyl-phosphate synthase (glutamine-hydrolyzing) small subunit [Bacteroidales bacterium]
MKLVLEDGTAISGSFFGFPRSVAGEVIFNTAMTGYPESLSDPSYKGQILVLTYPLIGNYGVPESVLENDLPKFFESSKVQITGLIVADYSEEYNHWNASKSLGDWLYENKVPAMFGVDTRALTKMIREKGALKGKMIYDDQDIDFYDPDMDNLVDQVCSKERTVYGDGKNKILLIDCGVKNNIIRHVLKRDTTVIRVPWNYDFIHEDYDGILVSNGPGNPVHCVETIENLSKAMKNEKPIFGICLGNQLMALASGAKTYKLKYGHRSHNQPVLLANTNKAYITSQNHGFAIDQGTLPSDWEPLFVNLNDGTNEGIKHQSKPFFSVQFHPEASSGPTDTEFLFDDFMELVKKYKNDA